MRIAWLAVPLAVATAIAACHHAAPVAVAPQPNTDSIAAAQRERDEALARARQDSLDRLAAARREAEERLARGRADSLARLSRAGEARAILANLIHFDFDKAGLRPEDEQIMNQKLPILRANPTVRIQIAGNCDERGSDEYNLALGNRRAIQAKQYLVQHGIEASRIEIISNGKEHPIDPGHSEQAWAMDRNDQFTMLNSDVALQMPS